MANGRLTTLCTLLNGRLDALAGIVRRGAAEDSDAAGLLTARLAPDMAPFTTQILFACQQPLNLAALLGSPVTAPDGDSLTSFDDLQALIASTKAALSDAVAAADDAVLATDKRVDLPGGAYIPFTVERYVDEWVLPNTEFHMAMAYALLRGRGVGVGKADWMAHLAPHVRMG